MRGREQPGSLLPALYACPASFCAPDGCSKACRCLPLSAGPAGTHQSPKHTALLPLSMKALRRAAASQRPGPASHAEERPDKRSQGRTLVPATARTAPSRPPCTPSQPRGQLLHQRRDADQVEAGCSSVFPFRVCSTRVSTLQVGLCTLAGPLLGKQAQCRACQSTQPQCDPPCCAHT